MSKLKAMKFKVDSPEHFLIHDSEGERFVTMGYWTQPKTEKVYEPLPEEPAPFPTRKEHRRERMFALLKVMEERLSDNLTIADEMISELVDLNKEMGR